MAILGISAVNSHLRAVDLWAASLTDPELASRRGGAGLSLRGRPGGLTINLTGRRGGFRVSITLPTKILMLVATAWGGRETSLTFRIPFVAAEVGPCLRVWYALFGTSVWGHRRKSKRTGLIYLPLCALVLFLVSRYWLIPKIMPSPLN